MLGNIMGGIAKGIQANRQREDDKENNALKKQLINLQITNAKSQQQQDAFKQKLIERFLQKIDQQQSEQQPTPKQEGADKSKLIESMAMSPEEMAVFKSITDIDMLGAGRLEEQRKTNQRLTRQGDERLDLQKKTFERGFTEGVPIQVTNPDGSKSVMRVPKFGSQSTFPTSPPVKDMPIEAQDSPLWIQPKTGERAPTGMTPSQAMSKGFKRITTGQVDSFKSFSSAEAIVGEVEGLMSKVFPQTESLAGRIIGGGKRKFGQVMQTNPEAAQLYSLIQGTLAPVVRAMGEKGNLSDTDMKRAINLFPELTDDADVAWGKIRQLKKLIGTLKTKSLGGITDSVIPTPKTKAEYDKLPRGTIYIDPDDGKEYRKP